MKKISWLFFFKKVGLFLFLAFLMSCSRGNAKHTAGLGETKTFQSFHFKNGDLLFQDLHCGALCNAIEAVTPHYRGMGFSHVGMVEMEHHQPFVVEASGKNVHRTPLDSFLDRSRDAQHEPRVVVGRLDSAFRHLIPGALNYCDSVLGTPYDQAFLPDNGKFYCSELLYEAFRHANNNKDFFPMHPMTFKDPETGEFYPAWVKYYQSLGIAIPQGIPGCNPGGLANDPKIEIVQSFWTGK